MLGQKYQTLLLHLEKLEPSFTDLEAETFFILRRINNPYQSRFTDKDKVLGLYDSEL